MRLLKVFDKGLKSPYQGMQFEVGEVYKTTVDMGPNDCAPGFYATDWDGLSYAYRKGREVWEVEVWGDQKEFNQFKRRYQFVKVIRKLPLSEIKAGLKNASAKAGYNLYLASFPKNPLTGKPKKVGPKDIEDLNGSASVWDSVWDSVWASVRASVTDSVWASVWDSVRDSVRASVTDSVWDSVWASVRASVRDSVWDSMRASVTDSVWAYMSSLFPGVKFSNDFTPLVRLWNRGFVPSFDGKVMRLHSGKNAEIVYQEARE